ncbi:MAG: hypothetical protein H3C64_13965 [Candidatus Kuenenia stuttgartiensis]|nr:hypothetical protein [Candidatus Kuenenia stuttgartiensis]
MNTQTENDFPFWAHFNERRVSFQPDGLPPSIHYTISTEKDGIMNFHITKNTKDHTNKPQIKIARFDKAFLDELMTFAPGVITGKMFRRFRLFPREIKNARALFWDEMEKDRETLDIVKELEPIIYLAFKGNKVKFTKEFIKQLEAKAASGDIQKHLQKHLRRLHAHSFDPPAWRWGILVSRGKMMAFICGYGKCYVVRKDMRFEELLRAFATPAFARTITDCANEALERIKDAETYEDTRPYNNPYTLYIEKTRSY